MQLEHSFEVPVPVEQAWRVLLDIERIASCMPGAALDSVDGDDFTGTVKVKLGPIGLTYKGKASFTLKDEAAHRAVIDARGRDARGNGTANAKVTATLAESGGTTKVDVVTDLDITGRPAQFGRGVMVDVGNKLIGQFASCLAEQLTADSGPPPAESAGPAAETAAIEQAAQPTDPAERHDGASAVPRTVAPRAETPRTAVPRTTAPRAAEPIDLIESAGPAIAKRLAPVAVAVVVVLLAIRRRRHH